ncbi:hypothetical protein OSB04_017317 [Centaurea solstitialis]|uniref:Uncharacterized protein n=1 Tax=Centaurea solstitialis TaxID=347529 RepID=A0AA38TKR8_9ASTR|nr:hypothetical protein OSB04_017317 [Centaurea solstitialis]
MLEDQSYHCHYRLLLLLKSTFAGSVVTTAGVQLTLFDATPYGFTLNNEFLFEPIAGYNIHLALYDPSEAKVKYFKFHGRMYGEVKVVEYVDSLVWIAPTESSFRKDQLKEDELLSKNVKCDAECRRHEEKG